MPDKQTIGLHTLDIGQKFIGQILGKEVWSDFRNMQIVGLWFNERRTSLSSVYSFHLGVFYDTRVNVSVLVKNNLKETYEFSFAGKM